MYAKVNSWNAHFLDEYTRSVAWGVINCIEVEYSPFVVSFHSRRQQTENPTASQICSFATFSIGVAWIWVWSAWDGRSGARTENRES